MVTKKAAMIAANAPSTVRKVDIDFSLPVSILIQRNLGT
jgi:hypothetical protein